MGERPARQIDARWGLAGVAGGLALVLGVGWLALEGLGLWEQLAVVAGVALIWAGAWWLFRRATAEAELSEAEELEFLAGRLREEARVIDERSAELGRRLAAYHGLREFPDWGELGRGMGAEGELAGERGERGERGGHGGGASEWQGAELREADLRVQEELERQSKVIFEKILANGYVDEAGKFQGLVLRDDLLGIVESVARIYRVDCEEPLLEVTAEEVLVFMNRLSLHLIVLLDSVPMLDLKSYSLRELYRWMRRGASGFKTYQAMRPYLGAASWTYRLGSVAMGLNPLTAALWIGGGEVVKRGGGKILQDYGKAKAVAVLGSVVRVVGQEAAGIYGGDFRHRDASWCYGLALVNLVLALPEGRGPMKGALEEIGLLPLRSEYDRLYLYRCLAGRKKAVAGRRGAAVGRHLSGPGKKAVASRLEAFYHRHVPARASGLVDEWRDEVEGLLGLRLRLEGRGRQGGREEGYGEVLAAVGSYLIDIKGMGPEEALRVLRGTAAGRGYGAEERRAWEVGFLEGPPMLFGEPDIDPVGPLVPVYFESLIEAELASGVLVDLSGILEEGAEHTYRTQDLGAWRRRWLGEVTERFESELEAGSPLRDLPEELVLGLLGQLVAGELPRFVYRRVSVEGGAGLHWEGKLWLVGLERRLVLVGTGGGDEVRRGVIWWEGRRGSEVEMVWEGGEVRVRGGEWLEGWGEGGELVVPGPTGWGRMRVGREMREERYFASLVKWV